MMTAGTSSPGCRRERDGQPLGAPADRARQVDLRRGRRAAGQDELGRAAPAPSSSPSIADSRPSTWRGGDRAMERPVGDGIGQRRAEDEQLVLEPGDQAHPRRGRGPGPGPRPARRSARRRCRRPRPGVVLGDAAGCPAGPSNRRRPSSCRSARLIRLPRSSPTIGERRVSPYTRHGPSTGHGSAPVGRASHRLDCHPRAWEPADDRRPWQRSLILAAALIAQHPPAARRRAGDVARGGGPPRGATPQGHPAGDLRAGPRRRGLFQPRRPGRSSSRRSRTSPRRSSTGPSPTRTATRSSWAARRTTPRPGWSAPARGVAPAPISTRRPVDPVRLDPPESQHRGRAAQGAGLQPDRRATDGSSPSRWTSSPPTSTARTWSA